MLCDDDRLFAPCIEMQARVLIDHPEATLACGLRMMSDANNFILPPRIDKLMA